MPDFSEPLQDESARQRFRRIMKQFAEEESALESQVFFDASQEGEVTPPMATKPASGFASTPAGVGGTPPRGLPAIDKDGFPLPRRVNEIDTDATRVVPSAYQTGAGAGQGPPNSSVPARPAPPPPQRGPVRSAASPVEYPSLNASAKARKSQSPPRADYAWGLGCFLRVILSGAFALVLLLLCVVSVLIYQYYRIASTLPDIRDLQQRASQFETTRILDRNGNPLYEILDPNAGRRTYRQLDKISPYMVAATIATEDKAFYSHPGFDVLAIFRAFWQNYQSGETVSGASTITQQLARALLFSPQERSEQTYNRKVREAILAAEITRRYTKDQILELYLNEIYFGNMAYGVEAAAETYFGVTADRLTLGQASFLAGLPQAPAVYDVYTNPTAAFARHEDVLRLMWEASQEQGGIYVSNNPQPIRLEPSALLAAANEIRTFSFKSPEIQMRYPHWVNYVRSLLEAQFDSQTIYRSGFTVYTTLDPTLQDAAQQMVRRQVDSLADRHVTDGALVAIRPSSGEILAMVGSADFYNEAISGQVNMAVSPRQPGSSIKPLTYAAAFEKGWTPSTLIWDVPSEFPPSGRADDPRPPYAPTNYDGRFHGPVTVRAALANSYNIPAVKALDFVGIYDNAETQIEDGFLAFARRMGITTLTRPDYGLSLTLGGGEVTLLELTNAYAVFANGGRKVPAVAITRILDYAGNTVYSYSPPLGDQVLRAEYAYLITSILSDIQARVPAFGANSILNLPFPTAVKTGTTNDFRDNWTMGYTPDLAVGVWVGNADFTPMQNTTGLTGAAPIWSEFMQAGIQQITGGNPTQFSRPGGIVEQVICAVSGTQPSQWCPSQTTELFSADQPPLSKEQDLWQKAVIDTWTGLRASAACDDFVDEQFVINVADEWAQRWISSDPQGQAWAKEMGFESPFHFAPQRECAQGDPRPVIIVFVPKENDTIVTSSQEVHAVVDATAWFDFYQLDYGEGMDPEEWVPLFQSRTPVSQPGLIYRWDIEDLPPGAVTLRLTLYSTQKTYAELKLPLYLMVPTRTPTPTPTFTFTPTPTETPTPSPTLPPTLTPTITSSPPPTGTPEPTFTPLPPVDTPSLSETPPR